MCRSVMIKGLEALVIESYATARPYGVDDHVLPTLAETFPRIDWTKQGAYFFSRVVQHGKRRAEEMREAANTVREAGFEPFMAAAIAGKQQWVADVRQAGVFEAAAEGRGQSGHTDRRFPKVAVRCSAPASIAGHVPDQVQRRLLHRGGRPLQAGGQRQPDAQRAR